MLKDILAPEHIEDLKKSGLTDEIILKAGIKSVRPADITKKLGFSIPDIVSMYEIPYPQCDFSRFRVFYNSQNAKKPKYLQKRNTGNRLYIPYYFISYDKTEQILKNTEIEIYITEGEKKALKAIQEGLFCIGLAGLWNWCNKKGELIADFDRINFKDRKVYIIPDNDWLNPDVHGYRKNLQKAVFRFCEKLSKLNAKVEVILL